MDSIDRALIVAKNNLRACYGNHGIFAGMNHFRDYWARDSFFASLGSLCIEDNEIVKKNLLLFLENTNKKGQIPLRIGKSSLDIVLSYIGIKSKNSKRKAIFFIDKGKKIPVDQNSLFIIALYEYMKQTKNYRIASENIIKIEKIMQWTLNLDHDKDLLIEEDEYCNWADSVKKKGKVLYSNVCYCHSLKCLAEIYGLLGYKERKKHFEELHSKVRSKINELFWSGEHYLDWIDKDKQYNYFSTDGNVLAILWDIADKEKARHIEEASHIFDINDIPSLCVHPPYPCSLISMQTRILGIGDYHNGLSWLWLGAINAIAKHKLKMNKEALLLIDKISKVIIENKGIYEVYERTGKPVKRTIYKSEYPFAWSSGLFIYAAKEILKKN